VPVSDYFDPTSKQFWAGVVVNMASALLLYLFGRSRHLGAWGLRKLLGRLVGWTENHAANVARYVASPDELRDAQIRTLVAGHSVLFWIIASWAFTPVVMELGGGSVIKLLNGEPWTIWHVAKVVASSAFLLGILKAGLSRVMAFTTLRMDVDEARKQLARSATPRSTDVDRSAGASTAVSASPIRADQQPT
jgi:hypothetical protein